MTIDPVRNILGQNRGWKPSSGDYDVDTGHYDIDHGECGYCSKKLHSKKERKNGLCYKCEKQAKYDYKRENNMYHF